MVCAGLSRVPEALAVMLAEEAISGADGRGRLLRPRPRWLQSRREKTIVEAEQPRRDTGGPRLPWVRQESCRGCFGPAGNVQQRFDDPEFIEMAGRQTGKIRSMLAAASPRRSSGGHWRASFQEKERPGRETVSRLKERQFDPV